MIASFLSRFVGKAIAFMVVVSMLTVAGGCAPMVAALARKTRAYGPIEVSCPPSATVVKAGDSIQAAIDQKPARTSFCIKPGEYRLARPIRPKAGVALNFESGAVLNGSQVVTDWMVDGQYWVASGQKQSFDSHKVPCELNPAACEYEDLFMDDVPLVRVLTLSQVAPGTFYFDEAADKIYIGEDPAAHKLEAPVTSTAIEGPGIPNVTIRGATIEKFGVNGIVTGGGAGWLVERNEIRYVHSHGLRAFGESKVLHNYIHHAGNMGIFGSGTNLVFDTNHLAYNNYLNFGKASGGMWHAGATKIMQSKGTVVRNNWSHDNIGDGWWFDWDNIDTVVHENVFENNSRFGLFYEASHDARIFDNKFANNGRTGKWSGAGLWIETSRNVEVYNNTFSGNRYSALAFTWTDRGTSSAYGRRELSNLYVHDNLFKLTEGFIGVPYGVPSIYSSNNRFANNTYIVPDTSAKWWSWEKSMRDFTSWKKYGHDATGTVKKM
jgi:Right handed beta helix region